MWHAEDNADGGWFTRMIGRLSPLAEVNGSILFSLDLQQIPESAKSIVKRTGSVIVRSVGDGGAWKPPGKP